MTAHFPTFSRSVQRQMEAYKRQLIENVVRLRKEKGWAQKALAFHADVAQKTIERLEKGEFETSPRAGTLRKIADALGVNVSDIKPDPEAEEREVRDQLDKIEQKTLDILSQMSELAARVEEAASLPADQSDSEESAATDSDGERRLVP